LTGALLERRKVVGALLKHRGALLVIQSLVGIAPPRDFQKLGHVQPS